MRRRWFVASVLAAPVLAAPAAVAAAAPGVVRVAISDSDLAAEPLYGSAAGIFRRYGLHVVLVPSRDGGAGVIRALRAGTIDVGFSNLISVSATIERGGPIVLIAPAGVHHRSAPVNAIVVLPNSPIRSGKDLDGKSISSPSGPGSAGALAPAAWIDQHGGDSRTVHFVTGIQPFDVPAALRAGRIAAAEMGDPDLTILRQRGQVQILCSPFDAEGDDYLLAAFIASKPCALAHRATAHRFAAAMAETARWSNAHRAQTGAILARRLHLAPSVVAAMSRTSYAERFVPAQMQPPLDVAARYGLLRPIRAEALLRASEV
jgi:NitT/TauT family transport system substrate-binding protein